MSPSRLRESMPRQSGTVDSQNLLYILNNTSKLRAVLSTRLKLLDAVDADSVRGALAR
jgi:hypothetical protein